MAPKRPRVSKPNTDDDEISSLSQWICETVKGCHEFKIKGYSTGIGVGESMTSGEFNVGGHEWVMEFHLDDETEASEEYLSLYLKGFERYMKRSKLETSDYLKDDCLNIHCTIIVKTCVKEGKYYVIPVPPSDMNQNLKGLLESGTGSDVTIQVGSEFFKDHKLILAARSPVFKAMFFGLVGNPDIETVSIEEFDPFAFKAMLLFLYSDELPVARELCDSDSLCTSTTIMQHLLVAADHFGLARLKLMCEAKLCEEITANNVARTLVLADKHQFSQLKTICLNVAAKAENVEKVLKSDGFADLAKSCPSLLIDLLKTDVVVNGN
ncbi:BTB/POZ and MATH domain-containing protein 3-like [Papaver somniferum]|uniref:BTB/POZ and MATH domain-containing protein 3-like n=1 Tax=Papaver somniferum TaxID=3469 RepID=UPI000E6F519D|nr:BTB/POZ and MATH domain-containing protein 3-like [Papaver somniferum]